jgi:hypothetical protein
MNYTPVMTTDVMMSLQSFITVMGRIYYLFR